MKMTVRDVAELLNVSEKTVYRWVDSGILRAYRVNKQYRFNRSELIEWAIQRGEPLPPQAVESDGSDEESVSSLADALKAGGVFYRVAGRDKPAVLSAVVDLLRLPEQEDRAMLLQVLLAREALGSTGVGEGIAIPHPRSPIVLNIHRPMVVLCFLDQPIDFGAVDGRPVHTLFTLICPTVRAHLFLLSRLAFALQKPQFKDALARQAGRDEVLALAGEIESALLAGSASASPEVAHPS